MNKLLRLCKRIAELPQEEIDEAEKMARGQLDYLSPLKMATTKKMHALGDYNIRVLIALAHLRATIKTGPQGGVSD